jgi:hypothetical protein
MKSCEILHRLRNISLNIRKRIIIDILNLSARLTAILQFCSKNNTKLINSRRFFFQIFKFSKNTTVCAWWKAFRLYIQYLFVIVYSFHLFRKYQLSVQTRTERYSTANQRSVFSIEIRQYRKGTYLLADIHGIGPFPHETSATAM